MPTTFEALVALVEQKREAILHAHLLNTVHLVRYEPGALEFRPAPQAPKDLAGKLQALMSRLTGKRWMVSVSNAPGQPTLREQAQSNEQKLRQETADHPLVLAVKQLFPDASITAVRERPPPGMAVPQDVTIEAPLADPEEMEGEPD